MKFSLQQFFCYIGHLLPNRSERQAFFPKLFLKPVILFKAKKRIKESEQNKENFHKLIEDFSTKMVENILNHENITVELKVSLIPLMSTGRHKDYDHIFNSMAIDEYYGFKYGKLPYLSLIHISEPTRPD